MVLLALPAQNVRMDQSTGIDPVWYQKLKTVEANLNLFSNLFSSLNPNMLVGGQTIIWDATQKTFVPGPAAWTPYVPTLSPLSGSFTSASAAGRYSILGKTIFVTITVTITTNGTAATAINVGLPFTAASNTAFTGSETASSGKQLQGRLSSGSSTMLVVNYDATYPGGNGFVLRLSGVYEST